MKKALLFVLGFAFWVASAFPQCLFYRYTKYERDSATDTIKDIYSIRIYRIIDDVSVKYQEYTMNELLDSEIQYYTSIVTNVNGDYISFYFEDSNKLIPRAQYKIDGNAKLTKVDFDESRSSENQIKEELAALEAYSEKNGKKPVNGWTYSAKLTKLDDNGTFYWSRNNDSNYFLIKKNFKRL